VNPPPFAWEAWYDAAGGRTIQIEKVDEYLRLIREEQEPRFTGPVADRLHHFDSSEAASTHLKERARQLGADIVGICRIEPSDVYRGRTVTGTYAVAVGQRMRWREFQVVPSRESAIECLRVYFTLGETVIELAAHIRSLGYVCTVEHPIGDSDLLHIPTGLKAGFGELGRHGSIINPTLGPLFRMGSVATSMDLSVDRPIDAGIAKFCDTCRACRKYCPADAIPDQRSPDMGVDHLGYARYVVDTGRCFRTSPRTTTVSICLPVCVYNHKEWARDFDGAPTRLFPEVVLKEPPAPVEVPEDLCHAVNRLNR